MKTISIPEDVLTALKIPKRDVEKVLKIEELGKRKIERHYAEKRVGGGFSLCQK